MKPFLSDCARMVQVGAETVIAQRGYKCTNGSDTKIVRSWLELFILLVQHVPSLNTRRQFLDTLEGYIATTRLTLEFYGEQRITVDVVQGMLKVDNDQFTFTPMPPPIVSRPHIPSASGAETTDSGALQLAQATELMAAAEREFGADSPETIACAGRLAGIYLQQKTSTAEAERLAEMVKRHNMASYGEKHPDTIISMHRLALAYKAGGKQQEYDQLYNQTTKLKQDVLSSLEKRARFDEMERVLRKIVAFDHDVLKQSDPEAIRDLGLLGASLAWQGKTAEADETLGLAADLADLCLGRHHDITLLLMFDFAKNCVVGEKFEEAKKALWKVKEAKLATLPAGHPDVLESQKNFDALSAYPERPGHTAQRGGVALIESGVIGRSRVRSGLESSTPPR
jgi:hypothetical protein